MAVERFTVRVEVGGAHIEISGVAETEHSWQDLTASEIKAKVDKAYRSAIKTILETRSKS